MPTIIGGRATDGVAIAGDRTETRGGRIVSNDCRRIFELDGVAVGVAGPASGVQFLHTHLEDRLRGYEHRHGSSPGARAVERMLADLASDAQAACLSTARDEDGHATLLLIDAEGGRTREPVGAVGTGAELAIGSLDRLDASLSREEFAEHLRDILRTVAERDAETGEAIDVVTVADGG